MRDTVAGAISKCKDVVQMCIAALQDSGSEILTNGGSGGGLNRINMPGAMLAAPQHDQH